MKDEKKVEEKKVDTKENVSEEKIQPTKAPLREILIQTDGSNINLTKNEVTMLELREICRTILDATYKKQNG